MADFNDRINVIGSGDNVAVIGKLVPAVGTTVNFHGNIENVVVTAIGQGIITATGVGGVSYNEYHFHTYVKEANIPTGALWPTGTGCFRFD